MVGRIAGITKMSDCERTLLRLTKDNRKTGHVGGEGRDLSTAGNAVAWGGAGGARAPPIIWQTPAFPRTP